MPRHRGLSLRRFVFAVPWDFFERYFGQLKSDSRPNAWAFLNPNVLEDFLSDTANAEASPAILEDFHRMNDLAGTHFGLLIRAYQESHVECSQDLSPEALAMQLFLDDRETFEYAWTMYLFFATPARVYEYCFPAGSLSADGEKMARMKANLQGWFANNKKGSQCEIATFTDSDGFLVRVSRGSYLKTVARWNGKTIEFETFRPASEDVLLYDSSGSRLRVQCGVKRDRECYVRSFAAFVAGDSDLADIALSRSVFSLEPIQSGSFEYGGYGAVTRVWLTEAHLRLPLLGDPIYILKSDDVTRTLSESGSGLSLNSGELTRVRLRFEVRLEAEKRPREVNVDIEPPGYSSLTQRAYAQIIDGYLRAQGAKLI